MIMRTVRITISAFTYAGINRKLLRFRGFMLESYTIRPFLLLFNKHTAVLSKVVHESRPSLRKITGPITER